MKRMVLYVASLFLMLLIGAASVVAWQQFGVQVSAPGAEQAAAASEAEEGAVGGGIGERVMELSRDSGNGPVNVRITTRRANELPDRPADGGGVFLRRVDDTVFIGTGNITLDIEVHSDNDEPVVNVQSDGPEVEVVVTRDTLLFEDVTDINEAFADGKSGDKILQQKVRPGSLEEVGQNMELEVWGTRRGDRLIAEVIVYRMPGF